MHKNLATIFVSAALLLAVGVAHAQDTLLVTLQDVARRALAVSPDLGAVRADKAHADARMDLARASRILPELSSNSAFSLAPGISNPNGVDRQALYLDPAVRNDFSSLAPFAYADISLAQPIYTWGLLGASLDAASSGVDVEAAAVAGKELDVVLRAAELYFNVLLAEGMVRLTDRAGDVVDQAKREIARLLEEGNPDVDEAERYQVLITEQEFLRRVAEVLQRREVAYVGLRRQLLLQDSTILVPKDNQLRPLQYAAEGLEVYLRAAYDRPEMQQARAGLAARDALVRVARADYYPQVVFVASASVGAAAGRYRQPNPFVSDGFRVARARTGIGIRQKLNFSQTRASVAQARAERDVVDYQLQAAEQLVLFEVELSWRELLIKKATLVAQDSSLAISKEWLRVEYINFDLDLGDAENLIKAVQFNLELEARYLEAVQAYNMAVLRLLAAAGLLVRHARGDFPLF